MDEPIWSHPLKLGDQNCSDVIVCLKNEGGKPECFHSHSFILKRNSNYFANKLLRQSDPVSQLDIHCTFEDYEHYVELLKRLYYPVDSLLDSWDSVRLAVGVLQVAVTLDCEEIIKSCIEYLEAVPWEDKEEELILKVAAKLGSAIAMPIMARIQPVDTNATKTVFISAIRFATSASEGCCLPFLDGNGLKTSAQEQIEYMLSDDDGMPLIRADDEVKTEAGIGLSRIFSSFETELSSLLSEPDNESSEKKILRTLSDLDWMCSVLPKMDMMKDFVFKWTDISSKTIETIEDEKLGSVLWDLKVKLIEVATKVLEAVGYGNVIVPAQSRVNLVKTWLPYIRKTKPVLDSMENKRTDEDLWQNIEGALVSLILALPSNDQAEIFMEWMKKTEEVIKYPDLSEAFEVWCYRSKSAKRRLVEGIEPPVGGNTTVSL